MLLSILFHPPHLPYRNLHLAPPTLHPDPHPDPADRCLRPKRRRKEGVLGMGRCWRRCGLWRVLAFLTYPTSIPNRNLPLLHRNPLGLSHSLALRIFSEGSARE